jgi:nucleotide-binding universal stress UspA family protein
MSRKPYIVVTGTDYSEHADRALLAAYDQAAHHAPAELHVLHATLVASMVDSSAARHTCELGATSIQSLEEQRAELLRHVDAVLTSAPGVSVIAHVAVEAPTIALTHLASALDACLIVVGSHGRHGVARWLLGSVAEAVVRMAECPVLVVPPRRDALPEAQLAYRSLSPSDETPRAKP